MAQVPTTPSGAVGPTHSPRVRAWVLPAFERIIPGQRVELLADDEEPRTHWVPKYDPDNAELPDWERIWDVASLETAEPRLIRVYQGSVEPSWAHEPDVLFLGEFPEDLPLVRTVGARWIHTGRVPTFEDGVLVSTEVRAPPAT